jgi:hypothetical protein
MNNEVKPASVEQLNNASDEWHKATATATATAKKLAKGCTPALMEELQRNATATATATTKFAELTGVAEIRKNLQTLSCNAERIAKVLKDFPLATDATIALLVTDKDFSEDGIRAASPALRYYLKLTGIIKA